MNEDWKTNLPHTPTNYALTADPDKPLRESQAEVERLNKQIASMRADYLAQMEKVITERNVYRQLIRDILNLKD